MFQGYRLTILAIFAGWTLLFTIGSSFSFRSLVSERLEAQVNEKLHADPALQNVEVVFDGLEGFLDGVVSNESLLEKAFASAEGIGPGKITENRIMVAQRPARLRATFDGNGVILTGAVSDEAVRGVVVDAVRGMNGVVSVEDQLETSAEVRTAPWLRSFVDFLPKFVSTAENGAVEASDQAWAMEGELSSPQQREELVVAWEKVIPAHAIPNLAKLVVIEKATPATLAAVEASAGAHAPESPPNMISPDAQKVDPMDELVTILKQSTVFFPSNSSYMSSDDVKQLNRAAKAANAFSAKLEVIAFADATGDSDYNLWLSNKRAGRVKEKLTAAGAELSRIHVEVTDEVKDNKNRTEEEQAHDRRVEIRLVR